MSDKKHLAVVLRDPLDEIKDTFTQRGIVEWNIKFKGGYEQISARTKSGDVYRISSYSGNGFRERNISHCQQLTPAKRQLEAKRLSREGLTQAQIAERLGCSQRTISNDLRGQSRRLAARFTRSRRAG